MRNKLIITSAVAVLVLGLAGTALAQQDYQTYFTFSGPVALPGTTLPAGTYLFRLADPNSSRKVINVLSQDGKKSLAMLLSIPNRLPTAPQNPEVRFMEAPANAPQPIKAWWYAGNSIGYEFIYPRRQALQLAKASAQPVLTTRAETTDLEKSELARVSPAGEPAPVVVEERPAPAPATGRAQQGEVAPAPQVAVNTPRTQLPRTASQMPLVIVLGGLALFAGVGLMLRRPVRS
jgi:LPXTG-motif cell wall-anchored protein